MSNYYFSTLHDGGDGSKERPFLSLLSLKDISLKKGDKILLECGSFFKNEYIHLINAIGTKTKPIVITSYGNGNKPIIDSSGHGVWYEDFGRELDSPSHKYKGDVSSTILLLDSSYITIKNIEIQNTSSSIDYSSYDKGDKTGIAVTGKNHVVKGIKIKDVTIKNVKGNVYDKHLSNGGIVFTIIKGDGDASKFEDVLLDRVFLYNLSRWGINIGYTYMHEEFKGKILNKEAFLNYGHKNIKIKNTYVKNAGGDGITIMYSSRPLIKNCRTDSIALEMNDRVYTDPRKRGGKVAASVWFWKCYKGLITHCEVYDTKLNQDGVAYDADSGWSTVVKHSYSKSNEGGAVMFCESEAVNSLYKKCYSYDDLGGTFSPSSCEDGVFINNKIEKRETTPLLKEKMSNGKYIEKNNKIITIRNKDEEEL